MHGGSNLEAAVRDRGIPYLLHFTKISNLSSIIDNGFLSREIMWSYGIGSEPSAADRLDGRYGAVSMSVSAFNPEMFYAKRKANGRADWVVLLVDPSVLWTHPCRFLSRNAGRNDMKYKRGFLGGPWGFNNMFSNEHAPFHVKGAGSYREETGIPPFLATMPDAEVQVMQGIDSDLILGAWAENRPVGEYVQSEMNRLPGEERNVLIRDFGQVFSNGYSQWGCPIN